MTTENINPAIIPEQPNVIKDNKAFMIAASELRYKKSTKYTMLELMNYFRANWATFNDNDAQEAHENLWHSSINIPTRASYSVGMSAIIEEALEKNIDIPFLVDLRPLLQDLGTQLSLDYLSRVSESKNPKVLDFYKNYILKNQIFQPQLFSSIVRNEKNKDFFDDIFYQLLDSKISNVGVDYEYMPEKDKVALYVKKHMEHKKQKPEIPGYQLDAHFEKEILLLSNASELYHKLKDSEAKNNLMSLLSKMLNSIDFVAEFKEEAKLAHYTKLPPILYYNPKLTLFFLNQNSSLAQKLANNKIAVKILEENSEHQNTFKKEIFETNMLQYLFLNMVKTQELKREGKKLNDIEDFYSKYEPFITAPVTKQHYFYTEASSLVELFIEQKNVAMLGYINYDKLNLQEQQKTTSFAMYNFLNSFSLSAESQNPNVVLGFLQTVDFNTFDAIFQKAVAFQADSTPEQERVNQKLATLQIMWEQKKLSASIDNNSTATGYINSKSPSFKI